MFTMAFKKKFLLIIFRTQNYTVKGICKRIFNNQKENVFASENHNENKNNSTPISDWRK